MEKRRKEEEGSTVLVAFKMDSKSWELLTWTLVKLAAPGDLVVALHVSTGSMVTGSRSSLISFVKVFDSVLAFYEGFCNLKQINLKMKACGGPSLRKALVREAISCSASKLVLGTWGIARASIAKYCAKKLPLDCSVLAVSGGGKIVFERESLPSRDSYNNLLARDRDPLFNLVPFRRNWSKKFSNLLKSDDEKGGWAILRRTFLPDLKTSLSSSPMSKSKVSVLRWVMSRLTSDRKNSRTPQDVEDLPAVLVDLKEKYSSIHLIFSYEELKKATSNFSPKMLIGEGGSSRVFKGLLTNEKEVAVKILKSSPTSLEEFIMEIEIIVTLRHKNIVSLEGFCFEGGNLALVYCFLPNGSLEDRLHGEKRQGILSWSERMKIAVGAAEALEYLHCEGVVHRDVKASNILLSEEFEPKLCDFGLALVSSSSSSTEAVTATGGDVAGTFGYLAPEYLMLGKATKKSDVYSFGVVLLELLSGRRPLDISSPNDHHYQNLVILARKLSNEGRVEQLVDPLMDNEYDEEQLESMILAASLCTKPSLKARPSISTVRKLLQGDKETLETVRVDVEAEMVEEEGEDLVINKSFDIQSIIDLALLGVEDESVSGGSPKPAVDIVAANSAVENYLRGRSSHFD